MIVKCLYDRLLVLVVNQNLRWFYFSKNNFYSICPSNKIYLERSLDYFNLHLFAFEHSHSRYQSKHTTHDLQQHFAYRRTLDSLNA